MITFTQWLLETGSMTSPSTPRNQVQKTVASHIAKVVADNPNTVTSLRQGTPADKSKAIGDITSNVVKRQQQFTPNISGQQGADVSDIISNIDQQANTLAKKAKMKR